MSSVVSPRIESSPELERPPVAPLTATLAVAKCAVTTVLLLARRRIRQPVDSVGTVLTFADGTSAPIYRETVVPHEHVAEPVGLVVEFRLRWIRGRGHGLFRAESLLNYPLFVGFPGLVSKLWLAHDQRGAYRGVYEWDGADRAHAYARALWWVLALVSERSSIHYVVLPGYRRTELVTPVERDDDSWWRVTGVE